MMLCLRMYVATIDHHSDIPIKFSNDIIIL